MQFDAKNKSDNINHTIPYHILLQKKTESSESPQY